MHRENGGYSPEMPESRSVIGRSCFAAWLASLVVAASSQAQVISTQPIAPLGPLDYLASTRLQFGLTQPATYQGAIVGGSQITSDQQAAITAAGGLAASTNPPFWTQLAAGNNFRLTYTAATQTLSTSSES